MPSTPLHFPAAPGHELAARLELPAGEPRAYALFAHCFTCSKDSKAAAYIGQALAARGIAVLRFDFTGLGMSGGDFSATPFSRNIEDLLAAVEHLRSHYRAPRILIGHSLGGAAVLAAAAQAPEARAVATIGAPFEPKHVAKLFSEKDILLKGEAEVDIGGRPFRIRKQFLDDLERHNPAATIVALRNALLLLHPPRAHTVPP